MTKYQRKRETVEAREVKDDETVVTSAGSYTAREGDFVVTMDDGDHVVPRDQFLDQYETVGGGKKSKKSTAKKSTAKKSTARKRS